MKIPLLALLALALPSPLVAQQTLDPARMHPVTVPVRYAGTFDWSTKTWIRPDAPERLRAQRNRVTVYNNTCAWTGGSFYYGIEDCEQLVDSGRIPATDTPSSTLPGNPQGLVGVRDDQLINNFQLSYCTGGTGQLPIQVGFYDNLRGPCAGDVPVTGKPFQLTLREQAAEFGNRTAYFDFGPASDWSLPSGSGVLACWTIDITFHRNNGFCLQSEGDGSWDNDPELDHFSWSFEHDLPPAQFGNIATGPIIAGEPNIGPYGSGSYNIPYGSNPVFGGNCGTGFGNEIGDGWWLNVDGSAPGVYTTLTGAGSCAGAATAGSNCYWFGGWPGGPLGSFWMVLDAVGSCSGCDNRAVTYCTAGSSANGCQALIGAAGSSSATAGSGFVLSATGASSGADGIFLLGTGGRGALSWEGGSSYLCVRPPLRRSGLMTLAAPRSGDAPGCEGSYRLDLNDYWTRVPEANPGAGARVQAQLWYRDPLGPRGRRSALSNAVEWVVCP